MGVRACWLEDFVPVWKILETKQIIGSHTAENLQISLQTVLNRYQIDSQKCIITVDRGSNYQKAMKDMKVFNCIIYFFNYLVTLN